MAEVHGTFDEKFAGVRDVLSSNLDSGKDVGASAAVSVEGELVVDIWGGVIDDAGTPWERDTITNVWSTTKTMTNLSALILADQGLIDLDAPVATYWPEFAANGKEGVLVRHLLAHTAGLASWTHPMSEADIYDWEIATSRLAEQAPMWEPGTASGYHALTQGYLVGEVIRRVTGQTIGQWFAKEVAGPLGADFHIGTGPEHDHRCAPIIPPPENSLVNVDIPGDFAASLRNPALDPIWATTIPWRRAEIPAAGGHGNARSVNRVQSVLANGGQLDDVRLLSKAGCDRVFEVQSTGKDLVLGVPLTLGIGYGLNSEATPIGLNPNTCFWGGWGGSIVLIDTDAHVCITYVMNRMMGGTMGDDRGIGVAFAAYAALMG
ncbi:MAG: beta-lactamase family protein [Actinomycetota bacterium]|nr:beta-lactamase family protein [Actinomycetota bacterium]